MKLPVSKLKLLQTAYRPLTSANVTKGALG